MAPSSSSVSYLSCHPLLPKGPKLFVLSFTEQLGSAESQLHRSVPHLPFASQKQANQEAFDLTGPTFLESGYC